MLVLGCDAGPGESSCTDGVDNDMNGLTDCDDAMCAAHVACAVDGSTRDGGVEDGGARCEPMTCSGCCDGDRCLSGESLAACGHGGATCEVCPLGATCQATGCEGGAVACGPANCDGCCMGDVCVDGGQVAACGSSGGGCTTCEAWEACRSGVCGVDPASKWRISLLDGVLPPSDFDGSDWDTLGAGEADPLVEVIIGAPDAGRMVIGDTISNTLTPDWTMGGSTQALSERVTAAQILAYLRFDMFDIDTTTPRDPVGTCR